VWRVAAGILPAVEPWLPARRKKPFEQPRNKATKQTFSALCLCSFVVQNNLSVFPGGKMHALYVRQDA
jgi:antirestriction protein ArdC